MKIGRKIETASGTALSAVAPGTTTLRTRVRRIATGTRMTTVTTTLAFVVPELTTGLEGPDLTRSFFQASSRAYGFRQNAPAAGVLVDDGFRAKTHRRYPGEAA